jgi:hypothetical protein
MMVLGIIVALNRSYTINIFVRIKDIVFVIKYYISERKPNRRG